MIDVQVVADAAAGDLHLAHSRKRDYYANNLEVCNWVREQTGYAPIVSTITSSWRGILAAASVNTWAQLGLPKLSLNVLLARVIEGGGKIYSMHHRTSGGARSGSNYDFLCRAQLTVTRLHAVPLRVSLAWVIPPTHSLQIGRLTAEVSL